jgi:predicted dienelactone hydrolase
MKHTLTLLTALLLAPLAVLHAADAPGPFAVETVTSIKIRDEKRGKDIEALVRLPKNDGGKLPLIVFSHGFGAGEQAFGPVSDNWASHGFVVVHPKHADAAMGARLRGGDTKQAIGESDEAKKSALREKVREMLREGRTSGGGFSSPDLAAGRVADVVAMLDGIAQIEKAVPALAGRIDRERIAVAGHSFGAATTLLIGGATTGSGGAEKSHADPRVRCLIVFSPSGAGEYGFTEASWAKLKLPMLFVTGTRDFRPGRPIEWRREAFDHCAQGSKYLLILDGATHFNLGGGPPGMVARFGSYANASSYTKAVKAVSGAFLEATLKASSSARESLTPAAVSALSPKVKSFETR